MNTEELKFALSNFIKGKDLKKIKIGNGTLVIENRSNVYTIGVNSGFYDIDVQRMICLTYLKLKPSAKEETTGMCKAFLKKHGEAI
jgi:hypothetical protein